MNRAIVTRLVKFLALIAVLLMPLGMTSAPAAAHHQPTAGMPMPHCPEQAPKHDTKGAFAECTMACSAALPAAELPQEQYLLIACVPTTSAVAQILRGLHPETATPPPKHS